MSANWCKYISSSTSSVYTIILDSSQTYAFAGGYYDAGSNDKIALVMRLKFSDGSNISS